jgi:pyridoxal phosphate enzyme (YggS family)
MLSASPLMGLEKSSERTVGMSLSEENLRRVLEKVRSAEERVGRTPGSITLIAVSKTKTIEDVISAARLGLNHFGENYVQEATRKMERFQASVPDRSPQWHLIGGLQTNKSKFVVGRFATIQSVDRPELAKALNKRSQEIGIVQSILLQIKLGDEPTKGGCEPSQLRALLDVTLASPNLKIEGLMTLPPLETEPEHSRKYFAQLRELREGLKASVPPERGSLMHLSMGTTHDFEVAIEEGATMVRIGTAIFGAREDQG